MLACRIAGLAAACEEGGRRCVKTLERTDWFDNILGAELALQVSPDDIAWLNQVRHVSHNALRAARSGIADVAVRDIRDASDMIAAAGPTIARAVATSFLNAERAYVFYREDCFDEAAAALEEAFKCDLGLERSTAIQMFAMHRVQLIHNKMRIELRRHRPRVAAEFGSAVLGYLELPGGNDIRILPEPWNLSWPRTLDRFPVDFICQMHGQIASEFVRAEQPGSDKQFLSAATISTSPGCATQVARWARVKSALRRRDLDPVYDDAIALLKSGPQPSLPMWRDVAESVRDYLVLEEVGPP